MDRDLYYEEEDLLCFGKKITNIIRKNEPFIYDFKDTEGNNHTLEFSFNKIDHFRHSVKKKNKIISPFTSVHFSEEAKLRRLALKAWEIYKESGKIVIINPDRAITWGNPLELVEEWWNGLSKSCQEQMINSLDMYLIQFKDENPNFPITVATNENPGWVLNRLYAKETAEIVKFSRLIGAFEGTKQKNRSCLATACCWCCCCWCMLVNNNIQKSKIHSDLSTGPNLQDPEANTGDQNIGDNDKRSFIRKDLSGNEHELQIDTSDCNYEEFLKAEALAKQSFKIHKQGGPVIIVDPNFALGSREREPKSGMKLGGNRISLSV